MQYRVLGGTGLRVSALSYGASPLGGAFGPVDETEGIRAVRTALDRGINLIDVSPYYGATRAETVLGKALAGVPRESCYLATKVGRYGPTVADCDYSAARVTASVEESLARLGVAYVDILQVHDIEFGSLAQIAEETIPALRRLQRQGKARFIGITGLPLRAFRYVLERAEVDTLLSYCHHTLCDDALAGLLPELQAKGIGLLNASPLAMGLLTDAPPPSWHPAPEAVKAACARAAAHCRSRGTSLARLALSWTLANPALPTTLMGMASAAQVEQNVAWAEGVPDPEQLAEVQAILAPVHNVTWPQGRPENN